MRSRTIAVGYAAAIACGLAVGALAQSPASARSARSATIFSGRGYPGGSIPVEE